MRPCRSIIACIAAQAGRVGRAVVAPACAALASVFAVVGLPGDGCPARSGLCPASAWCHGGQKSEAAHTTGVVSLQELQEDGLVACREFD